MKSALQIIIQYGVALTVLSNWGIKELRAELPSGAPLQLAGTEVFEMTSRFGLRYRIFIAKPQSHPPLGGSPVLYVLDANACFATAVESYHAHMNGPQDAGASPMAIVGVGYPTEAPFDFVRRTWDLTTPAAPEKLPPSRAPGGWPPHGGADQFLAFLEEEVKPVVEKKFPINRRRQAIFGHSFGGLFVLHAMCARPEAFQRYIASSPSFWWNDYALVSELRQFLATLDQHRQPIELVITVSGVETTENRGPAASLPPTPAKEQFGNTRNFCQQLSRQQSPKFSMTYREFAGENHGSVLPVALNFAVRLRPVNVD